MSSFNRSLKKVKPWPKFAANFTQITVMGWDLLTGKRKSNASQAAWRTTLVGYIGPPGEVKLYKQVFNLVLVVILSSMPIKLTKVHWPENLAHIVIMFIWIETQKVVNNITLENFNVWKVMKQYRFHLQFLKLTSKENINLRFNEIKFIWMQCVNNKEITQQKYILRREYFLHLPDLQVQ